MRRRQGYVRRFPRTSRAVNELNGLRQRLASKRNPAAALGEILDSALRTVNYHLARHLDCYSQGQTTRELTPPCNVEEGRCGARQEDIFRQNISFTLILIRFRLFGVACNESSPFTNTGNTYICYKYYTSCYL